MRERPILLRPELVREAMDGRKTQTRRPVKPQPEWLDGGWYWTSPRYDNGMGARYFHTDEASARRLMVTACPYGAPGDRLWVRERWGMGLGLAPGVEYAAGHRTLGEWEVPKPATALAGGRWRPSIHMPRHLCRLVLEITGVRAERIQAISGEDCYAEGVVRTIPSDQRAAFVPGTDIIATGGTWQQRYRQCFAKAWDEINGKRAPWAANPWLWVISFRAIEP